MCYGFIIYVQTRRQGTSAVLRILLVAAAVFLVNLPFGWWRQGTRKFSLAWAAAVHAPIPFVVALRLLSGLGFQWYTYPFLVAGYFGGQFAGGRWRRRREGRS